ncbi:MAG: Cof-type HAD-IIB family hydrolase [Defluviitaleaceae bacterium]|nr:Cof-type HAD-IIB family hydrolase [Defluviitaleaceae bacterium]
MIKMVVTDLDGTLLTSDKTISVYTKNVLERCREKDIKLVYATGRGASTARLAPDCFFDGMITMNGATARVGDETVYSRMIPWQAARPILTACAERGMGIVSESGGIHYANFSVSERWPSLMAECLITDFSHHDKDAEKIYTPNPTAEDKVFIEDMLPNDLYFVVTSDGEDSTLGQIMHKEATKGRAIFVTAELWGIKPREIAAFGDDYNDIDMLLSCGFGVAMGNANADVKNAAAYVCGTNDNDGVAKWLEMNVLNKTFALRKPAD